MQGRIAEKVVACTTVPDISIEKLCAELAREVSSGTMQWQISLHEKTLKGYIVVKNPDTKKRHQYVVTYAAWSGTPDDISSLFQTPQGDVNLLASVFQGYVQGDKVKLKHCGKIKNIIEWN